MVLCDARHVCMIITSPGIHACKPILHSIPPPPQTQPQTTSFTDAQPGQVLEACYTTALGRTIDLVTVLILPEEALVLVSPNRVEQVAASMGKYIFPLDRVELTRPEGVGGVYALVGEGLGAAVLGDGVMPMPAPGRCEVLEREGRVLVWGGTGLGLPGVMVAAMGPRAAAAVVEGAAAAGERAGGLRVGGIVEWEVRFVGVGFVNEGLGVWVVWRRIGCGSWRQ